MKALNIAQLHMGYADVVLLWFLDQHMVQRTKFQSSFDHVIMLQSVFADRAVSFANRLQ